MKERPTGTKPAVLVVDPLFWTAGGGGAVTAWTVQALRDTCDLTLLSWSEPDTTRYNRLFGTSLSSLDFEARRPPRILRQLGELIRAVDPDPYSVQRWALLMRWARHRAAEYDLVLSTYGEVDVATRCVQYVHYPYLGENGEVDAERWTGFRPWKLVTGWRPDRVRSNRTLVNSDWTGREFRRGYGDSASVKTVYPPVPGDFPDVPWEKREEGFVCVGRWNWDKRIETMVEIVERLRIRRPELHLHVIGTPTPDEEGGAACYAHVRTLAAGREEWLFLEEDVTRERLVQLLSRHRYGLHAKIDEHFGIAVAEMVRAGCITFAHGSGGPAEILGDDRLLFDSVECAVRRVGDVLDSTREREELRRRLRERARHFSTERFVRAIRDEVLEEVEKVTGGKPATPTRREGVRSVLP